jgi:hypothetical protein
LGRLPGDREDGRKEDAMTKALSLLFAAAFAGVALLLAAALAGSGDAERAVKRLCDERLCGVVFF